MLKKVYVEITNQCNLSCAFCPGTRRAPGWMTPEDFSRLAPSLKRVTDFVYFHVMGEPLLHPQLNAFFEIAEAHGLRVILTTNGTLLPQKEALLLSEKSLHKVNISLHAMESNGLQEDYLTGVCAFAKSASRQGILCCLRLWNLGTGQNEPILDILHRAFPQPWEENRRGFRLLPGVFLEWGAQFDWPDENAPSYGDRGFCYALRDQAGILCDGTVIPCCLDHEGSLALGNALQTPLEEILDSPGARAIFNGFSKRSRVAELCRHCGYAQRFSK